jgi:hypothetical protein
MTLSVTRLYSVYSRMRDELEKIWKETAVNSSSNYAGIYFEGLRKTSVTRSEDIRCRSRNSNQMPSEYVL